MNFTFHTLKIPMPLVYIYLLKGTFGLNFAYSSFNEYSGFPLEPKKPLTSLFCFSVVFYLVCDVILQQGPMYLRVQLPEEDVHVSITPSCTRFKIINILM